AGARERTNRAGHGTTGPRTAGPRTAGAGAGCRARRCVARTTAAATAAGATPAGAAAAGGAAVAKDPTGRASGTAAARSAGRFGRTPGRDRRERSHGAATAQPLAGTVATPRPLDEVLVGPRRTRRPGRRSAARGPHDRILHRRAGIRFPGRRPRGAAEPRARRHPGDEPPDRNDDRRCWRQIRAPIHASTGAEPRAGAAPATGTERAPAHPTGADFTATAAASGARPAGPGAARRGASRAGNGWRERRGRAGWTRRTPCSGRSFCSGDASSPSGGSFPQRAPLTTVGGGHTCGGAAGRLR